MLLMSSGAVSNVIAVLLSSCVQYLAWHQGHQKILTVADGSPLRGRPVAKVSSVYRAVASPAYLELLTRAYGSICKRCSGSVFLATCCFEEGPSQADING